MDHHCQSAGGRYSGTAGILAGKTLVSTLPAYLNALTGEEKGRDKIALWYQEKENIEYILGPIVESFDNLPEDAFQVTIAAGRYAVFESDQENDMENLPETVRMFARCVLYSGTQR